MSVLPSVALFLASCLAGAMNALAGGGAFVTFPSLLFAGLDPRGANITSSVALVPGQVLAAWAGREMVAGTGRLPFRALLGFSAAGGVAGALLLLATPPTFFARLVPWLVLFATVVYAWGSFVRRPAAGARRLGPAPTAVIQGAVAVYGGYFGGGMGFLMLATLTAAGQAARTAGATKNVLAAAINGATVLVFVFSPDLRWGPCLVVAVGSMLGGLGGAWVLRRVNERVLRAGVVAIGCALTVGLFARG